MSKTQAAPLDRELPFATIEPNILYFGNPVALISSLNEDGSSNLAPISSFWALGWTMTLGLLTETKTLANLEKRPECVVNIPSPEMWRQVEALAPLTGQNPVPEKKREKFRFEKDKFAAGSPWPAKWFLPRACRNVLCTWRPSRAPSIHWQEIRVSTNWAEQHPSRSRSCVSTCARNSFCAIATSILTNGSP